MGGPASARPRRRAAVAGKAARDAVADAAAGRRTAEGRGARWGTAAGQLFAHNGLSQAPGSAWCMKGRRGTDCTSLESPAEGHRIPVMALARTYT